MPITSLKITKRLACPPAYAYELWTNPALFVQWCVPGKVVRTLPQFDVRVGGRFRIGYVKPDPETHLYVGGVFLEVRPAALLRFTWIWESESLPHWRDETVVTVEFRPVGADGTDLVLTHERFTDENEVAGHTSGWNSALDKLVALAASPRT